MSETDSRARRGTGSRVSAASMSTATVRPDPDRRRDRAGDEQGHGPRQEAMLDGQDPVVEDGFVVAGQDRDRLLGDDRPGVQRGIDEMDRGSGDPDPMVECVAHGVGTREGREQARVGVEDPPAEGLEHRRPDDPHVAGEDDDIGPSALEGVPQSIVGSARDERRVDPLLCRPVQRPARPIGHHEDDLPAELAATRGRMERPEIGAGARHRDGDPAAHRARSSGPSR